MRDRATLMREAARAIRFGIVGVANTLINTVIFAIFVAIGTPYVAASLIASAIAIGIAYFLHHRFTFRADAHSRRLVGQFFVVQSVGALINVAALAATVESLGSKPLVAQLVIIPPVVAITFVANRMIVFRAHVDTRLG